MLRNKIKQRKEYLKSKENKDETKEKKQMLQESLRTNTKIPHELRSEAKDILDEMIYEMKDEEINYPPPKIAVTTSRTPSSNLKSFTKHMALIFNGFHLMRGSLTETGLYDYCITQGVTHLLIFRENKGNPSSMVFSKFPNGPTHYFSLFNVKYQRRLQSLGEKAYLIVDKMNTDIGKKLKLDLSLCFPKTSDASRVVSFINHNGTIAFRHCLVEHRKLTKECEFDMKLYKIVNSTFNMDGDVDYTLKSFMNSTKKDILYVEDTVDSSKIKEEI